MSPYDQDWHDMSDYVVHFTRASDGKTAYENIMSILFSRILKTTRPFGIARRQAPDVSTQCAVCFSEIPLHLISRLAERRGSYGIGFSKQFLLDRGGGPIWYVESDSEAANAVNHLMIRGTRSHDDPIWTVTPFIDSPGDYPNGAYRFEWEREWRHIGDLHFVQTDPSFLIIPEEFHERAHSFFRGVLEDNTGPAYFCPYIDPSWDMYTIRSALNRR